MAKSFYKETAPKWRWFLIIIATALVVCVVIYAVLKWWFPTELAMAKAQRIVENRFGVIPEIHDASIDPFARIELNGISISPTPHLPPLLRIKSVKIGYELWPLISRREFKINHILVDSVAISLETTSDGRWNFEPVLERLLAPKVFEKEPQDTTQTFPVRLTLDKLELRDVSVSVAGNTEDFDGKCEFRHLNLKLNQFTGRSLDDLHGSLIAAIPEGTIAVTVERPVQAGLKAQISVDFAVFLDPKLLAAEFSGRLQPGSSQVSFQQWEPSALPELSASAALTWDRHGNVLRVDPIQMEAAPFRLEMGVETTLDVLPKWSVVIKPMTLDLKSTLAQIRDLNIPQLSRLDVFPQIDGSISLDSLIVTGSGIQPAAPDFQARLDGGISVRIPHVIVAEPIGFETSGLNANFAFGGGLSSTRFSSASAYFSGGIQSFRFDSLLSFVAADSIIWDSQFSSDDEKTIQWQAGATAGHLLGGSGRLTAHAIADVPKLMTRDFEALQNLSVQAFLTELDLSHFGNDQWGARLSADFALDIDQSERISGVGIMDLQSPWLMLCDSVVRFPDMRQTVDFVGSFDPKNQYLEISPVVWQWTDVGRADVAVSLEPPNFHAEILHSEFDMSQLSSYVPEYLLPQVDFGSLRGSSSLTGFVNGNTNDPSSTAFEFDGGIENFAIRAIKPQASVEAATAQLHIDGDMGLVCGSLELTISQGGLEELFPSLLDSVVLSTVWRFEPPDLFGVDSFRLAIPSLAIRGSGNGNIKMDPLIPSGNVSFEIGMDSPDRVAIWDTISYSGRLGIIGSVVLEGEQIMLDGELQFADMCISVGSLLLIDQVSGKLPIHQTVDISPVYMSSQPPKLMAHRAMGASSYSSLRPSYIWNMPEFGTVTMDSVGVMGYVISNCDLDVIWARGFLEVPAFSCDAYGGNVQGNLWVEMGGKLPDSLRIGLQAHAAGIQTSQIVLVSQHDPEESVICADAGFELQGILGLQDFDISGSVDITRIGRGVALDLLQLMDPEGRDEGIQSTKTYLKQGWGVKMFSFAIRDGFVYSHMIPSAPPISRFHMYLLSKIVRLPPQIVYGRIPIKFLLRMQAGASSS